MDALAPEGQAVLALMVEAEAPVMETVLIDEVVRLIGPARVQAGFDQVMRAGLWFRALNNSPYAGDDEPTISMPIALRRWLGPELRGLLTASQPALDLPQTGLDPTTALAPGDPAFDDLLTLASLASVRPRVTGDRLYKKDAEKLASLLGLPGWEAADDRIGRLRARRLVDVRRDDDGEPAAGNVFRVQPQWRAAETWAGEDPARRGRDILAAVRRDPVWTRVCAAAGDWVAEELLERAYRFATPGYGWGRRGRGAQALLEGLARAWRATWEEALRWPEIEVGNQSGRRFLRLRPDLAAALSGRLPPPAKVHVQPNFEILAPREIAALDLLTLCRAADLRRADVMATFVLTPASVQRAALDGLGANALRERLVAMAAHGVPDSVLRSINDWVADVGRVALRAVTFVELDDAALADRAVAVLGKLAERVGPCGFVAARSEWPELVRRLRAAGMTPRNDRRADGRGGDDGYGGEGEPNLLGEARDNPVSAVRAPLPDAVPPALGLAQPPARVEALRRLRGLAAKGPGGAAAGAHRSQTPPRHDCKGSSGPAALVTGPAAPTPRRHAGPDRARHPGCDGYRCRAVPVAVRRQRSCGGTPHQPPGRRRRRAAESLRFEDRSGDRGTPREDQVGHALARNGPCPRSQPAVSLRQRPKVQALLLEIPSVRRPLRRRRAFRRGRALATTSAWPLL